MYYGIVSAAVVMFGFQFFFNQKYEAETGNGKKASMWFILLSNAVGFVILLAMNKFRLEFTPFTLICSFIAAVNMLLYNICSMKALGRINLSLYSLFSMLGGMALPFCAGIFFFDEEFTVGKIICLITVVAALLLNVKKEENKGGFIYYAGIFVFNGMSGVISKFFQALPYEKTSETAYSVWSAFLTVVFASAAIIFMYKDKTKPNLKSLLWSSGYGVLNKIGNLLLLISLVHLPVSVQYPMITGGVMIVSTLLSYFTPKKPGKRELFSVILSFAGIMALIFFDKVI